MVKQKVHKQVLRMDKQTKLAIKKVAAKNGRSLNSEIIEAIKFYATAQYMVPIQL